MEYSCPHCDGRFEVDDDSQEDAIVCPHCGQTVALPPGDQAEEEPASVTELDSARIQEVARARTVAMRARSYCQIGVAACGVAAIDLTWRAFRRIEAGPNWIRPSIYLVTAALLVWLSYRLRSKAAALRREALRTVPSEPTASPDFSNLSDGSQVVENLKRLK